MSNEFYRFGERQILQNGHRIAMLLTTRGADRLVRLLNEKQKLTFSGDRLVDVYHNDEWITTVMGGHLLEPI